MAQSKAVAFRRRLFTIFLLLLEPARGCGGPIPAQKIAQLSQRIGVRGRSLWPGMGHGKNRGLEAGRPVRFGTVAHYLGSAEFL